MFHLSVSSEIELRLWNLAEADVCFAAVERNRASLREWLPWVDRTLSAEDIRNYIRTMVIPQFELDQGPNCSIWVAGQFAGGIGCHAIDWPNRNCSVGYWLDAQFRGHGLMTRCCAALLNYLFHEIELHRVVIRCATGNTRSCAIPERLGFRRDGLEREAEWVDGKWLDLWIWSMLAKDWPAEPSVSRSS